MGPQGNLVFRCKYHDWESAEPRDLMERLEIMQEIKLISFTELSDIFKQLEPRRVATILNLTRAFREMK